MKIISIALMSLLIALSAWSDVTVSVTGTADSTGMGYTAGESYTFNWTLNDGYDGGGYDSFNSSINYWYVEYTTDPWLWSDVSGDGLSGTYSRPSGSSYAPYDKMRASNGVLYLLAGNDDSSSSQGLTVNGVELKYLRIDYLTATGLNLDYSDTSFVNPATWAATYAGTYDSGVSETSFYVEDESSNRTNFTATGFEIVPEPVSVGLFAGAGLLFALFRRFLVKIYSHSPCTRKGRLL